MIPHSFWIGAQVDILGSHRCRNTLPGDVLGPQELVAEMGPDYAGRYEFVFAQLRAALQPVAEELAALLALRDPVEQAKRVAPATRLGRAIDQSLNDVMDLSNLIALFGEGATRNRVEPFARHFAGRTRWALVNFPAADNPYLWQMYGGTYPKECRAPWLTAPAPRRLPEISWARLPMAAALKDVPGEFDFCHLSNILDWLSPDEAGTTLELAAAALRPGGWVLIRQLNSTLNIPSLGPGFNWHGAEAQAMHGRDRSFFYRQLHLGRKR
jgi:S-adenosylmethionine-diacylglycerol 3-amino-3-carboxypropyl transferase